MGEKTSVPFVTFGKLIEKKTANLRWTRCRIYEETKIYLYYECWKVGATNKMTVIWTKKKRVISIH